MSKEKKVLKLNQDEILSIITEYLNDSGDKYVSKQVCATSVCIFGKANEDLRLVCVLSNNDEEEIFDIDLEDVDKKYDFTGDKSVDLK